MAFAPLLAVGTTETEPSGGACAALSAHLPLHHTEATEAGRVDEGVCLRHPAARRQRVEVGAGGTLAPAPAGRRHQLVEAVGPEEVGPPAQLRGRAGPGQPGP